MAHSLTHPRAAEEADRREVEHLLLGEEIRLQMKTPEGRRFVGRLLEAARCDDTSVLFNSVATVQAQIVGVHDFVKMNLTRPLEEFCPELAEQMRREERQRKANDRNGSGSNTN